MIRLGKFWRFGKLVTAIITTILARMRSTVFIKLLAKTHILYQQTTASNKEWFCARLNTFECSI